MSAAQMAELVRHRKISPVELVEACIDLIERRDPELNAFTFKGYDDARRVAREAEDAVMKGVEVGPLHGVPTAMKDLYDFKPGWVSTYGGIPAFARFVANFSCLWVERMERAGAIILGKTNSPVMGMRATTDNPLFGPTRNPFDLTRNAGGSSGGSAAAVADGLVPFAEGSDAGGSIRIPAAWCGIYGFKSSAGRVPTVIRPNGFGGFNPFLHEGMMTRSVRDAALGLQVLSGYDPRDPMSIDQPTDFLADMERSIRGWRIAYSPDFGAYPVDDQVAERVAEAVRAFEEAGATVEEVDIDFTYSHTELTDMFSRLISTRNAEVVENFKAQGVDLVADHPEQIPPELHELIAAGYRVSALDLAREQRMRTQIFDTIQSVFSTYDLLITPTAATAAVPNATDGLTRGVTEIKGEKVSPVFGWCLTYLINLTGHPAASIPAGLTREGLPVGMQIIGRRRNDGDVIAASAAFEAVRPWQQIYGKNSA
ncbi:amidase [Sinosporangium album]|nr:amidase [Sinosporangium album]